MAIKRNKPEEIVMMLRQVEVLVGQGRSGLMRSGISVSWNRPITAGASNTGVWDRIR